ncbi:hypothetical protein M758_1G051200 [Ceratodon purpureus]|nr:hypothetical protein M758_1G051200 [Ceratodon purpureus]
MTSPTSFTARLRGKLTDWSDDDEDVVPRKVERSLSISLTPEEDVETASRELSPVEPSPPRIVPARKRIARAPCLDSDDEEEPYRFVKIAKVEHAPMSPKVKVQRDPSPIEAYSPVREYNYARAPRTSAPSGPAMQASVQPGCTQLSDGKRFLAYNMLGSISRVETEAGFAHVEVDFHDTSKGMRVPSMTDFFGFTMAALNERGSIFANPIKGDKTPSTIMYRPFNSWTSNSEWSMRFPADEEVKAVAIGSGWAAAATNQHFLRVFTEAGLQRFVFSLAGPVVSLAGDGDHLAVVTHASNPLPSGDQVLDFLLLNVRNQKRLLAGRLPLSPDSTLTWLGFTESGSLSSYDSQGILRVYSSEFNGCWIPVFSAAAERKKEKNNYWVVGLNTAQVYCVVCKAPETQPQVIPKPVMSVFNTTVPVVHSDLGADDLESDFLRGTLHLTHTRSRADEAAAAGRDDDEADEAVFKMEAELDRCLLRLIAAACKGDKLAKALELANQLSLHKSMEGALKLVTAMRLPALAERMNQLLEERSARERAEESGGHLNEPRAQALYPAFPPSRSMPELLRTLPSTQGNTNTKSQGASTSYAIADASPMQPSQKTEFRSALKRSHKKVSADAEPNMFNDERSSDQDSQAAALKAATVPQGSFVSLSNFKPSNPFAKKVDMKQSAEDKNDSILQSLKKMQTCAPEVKRKVSASTPQRPAKMGRVA